MPLYEITHSHPLDDAQKGALAEKVAYLHSRTFTTPSVFVDVVFFAVDATMKNYYIGGQAQTVSVNRIKAHLRVSEARTKQHFDTLAEKLEDAWDETVNGQGERQDSESGLTADVAAKKLLRITFVPIITTRKFGTAIPSAGDEGTWVKKNRKEFERRAELGEKKFDDMLREIDRRDDLAAWRS